jgi:MerR family transcriptional regulator, light-induced transcriptional regulator
MTQTPSLTPAADHYWSTLVRNDAEAAYDVVAGAIDAGSTPAEALAGIVVRSQRLIGESWAAGEWTVGQEHAATAISEEVVARVAAGLPDHDPGRPRLLVTCAAREAHSLGAEIVAVSLYSWGWPTDFLGPEGTPAELLERVAQTAPAVVLVSASLVSSLPRLAVQIADLTATGTPVVVGGAAFDGGAARARRLGASGYAATPEEARELLARLPDVVIPQPAPFPEEAGRLARMADELAREVLDATDASLAAAADALAPDHWRVVLATFTPHLVASVAGGVLTEDPSVPASARAWLTQVLDRRGAPAGVTDLLWEQLRDRLAGFPASRALLG